MLQTLRAYLKPTLQHMNKKCQSLKSEIPYYSNGVIHKWLECFSAFLYHIISPWIYTVYLKKKFIQSDSKKFHVRPQTTNNASKDLKKKIICHHCSGSRYQSSACMAYNSILMTGLKIKIILPDLIQWSIWIRIHENLKTLT